MENKNVLKGGEFLTRESQAANVFIPEEFSEEQQMIAGMCQDFLEKEIFPNLEQIDKNEPGFMRSFVSKAGELGLLGISVPEEFGGFGQTFVMVIPLLLLILRIQVLARFLFYITEMKKPNKNIYLNLLPENLQAHIASQNLMRVPMLTREKQKQFFLKTENIIFSMVRKCGLPMAALQM